MTPQNEGPPDLDEILKKLQQKSTAAGSARGMPGSERRWRYADAGWAWTSAGMVFISADRRSVARSGFYIVEGPPRRGASLGRSRGDDARPALDLPIDRAGRVVNVSGVARSRSVPRHPKKKAAAGSAEAHRRRDIVDVQFAIRSR